MKNTPSRPQQSVDLRRKALQMFTRRLDPATAGGAQRLAPEEESLFVDMVPSLRSVAMGKKAGGSSSAAESDDALEAGLEEVMYKVIVLSMVCVVSTTLITVATGGRTTPSPHPLLRQIVRDNNEWHGAKKASECSSRSVTQHPFKRTFLPFKPTNPRCTVFR